MIRPSRPRIVPHPSDPALALVPLSRGYFAVISVVDSASVGEFFWHARVQSGARTVYAARASRRGDGRVTTELLHRLIAREMGIPSECEIDHWNGNGLDCRRSNLRPATNAQNAHNARRSRNNSTGVKGVARHRNRPGSLERFVARVMVDNKSTYLGTFDTVEEAALAVAIARPVLHGEFANDGSQS